MEILIRRLEPPIWHAFGRRADAEGRTRQWVIVQLVKAYAAGRLRIDTAGRISLARRTRKAA